MPPLGIASLLGAITAAGHAGVAHDFNLRAWHFLKEERRDGADLWALQNVRYFVDESLFLAETWPRLQKLAEELVDEVARAQPDVIGVSLYFQSFHCARRLVAMLKARLPAAKIVYGGPSITPPEAAAVIEEFVRTPLDAAVFGEGEGTLVELLERWSSGASLDGCRGICHRRNDGTVFLEPPRESLPISSLPVPSFREFPLASYTRQGSLPLMMSRGCVAKCTFCAETRFWPKFRYRPAAEVFGEVRRLHDQYGVRDFLFCDSLVNGNIQMLGELIDLLNGWEVKINWSGYARIDKRMTPELLARMKSAGCEFLKYGFESGSQKVVDLMEKRATVETARQVIRDTYAAGIRNKIMVIVGFPGEEEEDFSQTMEFLRENVRYLAAIYPSELMVIPGLPIAEFPERFGISTKKPHIGFDWESVDEKNVPSVRHRRFRALQEFIDQNPLDEGSTAWMSS